LGAASLPGILVVVLRGGLTLKNPAAAASRRRFMGCCRARDRGQDGCLLREGHQGWVVVGRAPVQCGKPFVVLFVRRLIRVVTSLEGVRGKILSFVFGKAPAPPPGLGLGRGRRWHAGPAGIGVVSPVHGQRGQRWQRGCHS
jgi:hypothetical protein